jgi:hypothetical protein
MFRLKFASSTQSALVDCGVLLYNESDHELKVHLPATVDPRFLGKNAAENFSLIDQVINDGGGDILDLNHGRLSGGAQALDVFCPMCRLWLNGQAQWDDHKNGEKHRKNTSKGYSHSAKKTPDHKGVKDSIPQLAKKVRKGKNKLSRFLDDATHVSQQNSHTSCDTNGTRDRDTHCLLGATPPPPPPPSQSIRQHGSLLSSSSCDNDGRSSGLPLGYSYMRSANGEAQYQAHYVVSSEVLTEGCWRHSQDGAIVQNSTGKQYQDYTSGLYVTALLLRRVSSLFVTICLLELH